MHVHRWRRILETEVLTQYLGLACSKHPKLFFQFFPLGALGRHHLLHDLGAAGCIRDRETTAGAAAATTAATGEQSCARTNTATSRWETVNCQDCKFKWVNVSYEQPERSTLSLSDPVGAQHWNVRWDAGYDASCTWQDVRHGEGLTWTWDLLLSDVAGGEAVARRDRDRGEELQDKREAEAGCQQHERPAPTYWIGGGCDAFSNLSLSLSLLTPTSRRDLFPGALLLFSFTFLKYIGNRHESFVLWGIASVSG